MDDIIKIINKNPNIDIDLKDKIIECVTLIINKYPMSYRNLNNNLENITIRYTTKEDDDRLNKINAKSIYNALDNVLLINKETLDEESYKHILIHELLHVSSFNSDNLGFESLGAKSGMSFNEGMTEYLTMSILNEYKKGFAIYGNDVNNIVLLSSIIPFQKLVNLYFYDGLLGLFEEYINRVGSSNNLKDLIINMDSEHIKRARENKFDNEYKDKYIKLFIEDISKVEFDSDIKIQDTIRLVINFIKNQYKVDYIPETIKKDVETFISVMFGKLNIKGIKHV